MWKKDKAHEYYITCDCWTICKKISKDIVKYALSKDSIYYGYFDTSIEAKIKHRDITNENL